MGAHLSIEFINQPGNVIGGYLRVCALADAVDA
jgi:hypothetical protein